MIISIVYIRYTPRIYTVNKLEVCVYIFFSFDLGMWLALVDQRDHACFVIFLFKNIESAIYLSRNQPNGI